MGPSADNNAAWTSIWRLFVPNTSDINVVSGQSGRGGGGLRARGGAVVLGAPEWRIHQDRLGGLHLVPSGFPAPWPITAAFNLNLLVRINRELDGNFALDRFADEMCWNEAQGRIEMHLVSCCDREVRIRPACFAFPTGETIHTENSHKYMLDQFRALSSDAGYRPRVAWTDPAGLLSLHLLDT
jgi:Histidine-specific methyltransferase, SAM-dependent